MGIAYDKEESSEMNPKYYVYEHNNSDYVVIYKGTYTQCLVVQGAISIDPDITIDDIRNKTNGFI